MEIRGCSPAELVLAHTAADMLRQRRRPHRNTVCAGVLTRSGETFMGLDLASRKSSVCAEPAAIAAAHMNSEYDIIAVVAVAANYAGDIVVVSPCGACRELIWFHAPEARVLLPAGADPAAVAAADLFVSAEMFPKMSAAQ